VAHADAVAHGELRRWRRVVMAAGLAVDPWRRMATLEIGSYPYMRHGQGGRGDYVLRGDRSRRPGGGRGRGRCEAMMRRASAWQPREDPAPGPGSLTAPLISSARRCCYGGPAASGLGGVGSERNGWALRSDEERSCRRRLDAPASSRAMRRHRASASCSGDKRMACARTSSLADLGRAGPRGGRYSAGAHSPARGCAYGRLGQALLARPRTLTGADLRMARLEGADLRRTCAAPACAAPTSPTCDPDRCRPARRRPAARERRRR
jgi:hypothetical protein